MIQRAAKGMRALAGALLFCAASHGQDDAAQQHAATSAIVHDTVFVRDTVCPETFPPRRPGLGGGGGGLAPQLLGFDMGPLEDLQRQDAALRDQKYPFDKNTIFMIGGMGFGEVHNGIRIGGGAWVGHKKLQSDRYLCTDSLGNEVDSVAVLRLLPAYGAVLCEKAFYFSGGSLHAGGMLGAGALLLHRSTYKAEDTDVFLRPAEDSLDYDEEDYGQAAVAPLSIAEVHAGGTLALAPAFHVSLDALVLLAYAPDGFVTGTGSTDFLSVSPGLRLRVLFGRAG